MGMNSGPQSLENLEDLRRKILERHQNGGSPEEIAEMLDHYIAVGTQEADRTKTMKARLNFEFDLLELRVKLGQVEKEEIIEELADLITSAKQEMIECQRREIPFQDLKQLADKIQKKIEEL